MADIVGVNGQREEFRVVGKPNLPGILSYALAAGIAKFGIDYTAPDMLHAKFLRSPYAHARVVSIDTTRARALPGVVDIVLWDDPDLMKLGASPFGPPKSYLGNVAHQELQEGGAIVVCESEEICDEALRVLDVEWEVLPHVIDLKKGMQPDYPVIRTPEDEAHRICSRPVIPMTRPSRATYPLSAR
jgi:CO/xanthine dehydrogenase Mo-binding subunit